MALDIHAVLEYEARWQIVGAFADGELSIPYDWNFFRALGLDSNFKPAFPLRGLPDDYSDTVERLYFVSANDARRMIDDSPLTSDKNNSLLSEVEASIVVEADGHGGLIPDPRWFSPSWLSQDELEQALRLARLEEGSLQPEVRATLTAMRVLAQEFEPSKVRIVFWFGSLLEEF